MQRVLRGVDQRLQVFPASRHHLVAEDEQEITQNGEGLKWNRQSMFTKNSTQSKNLFYLHETYCDVINVLIKTKNILNMGFKFG